MAEKVTRKQVLENAIANLDKNLNEMLDAISEPYGAPRSKTRMYNELLARTVAKKISDEVTAEGVVNLGMPEITTIQRATEVLHVACELGLFGKKVTYKKMIKG